MNREDVIRYKVPLVKFIGINRSINRVFVISMIVIYSLSLYLLVEAYLMVAVILATLGFVLAKLMLRYSVNISLYIFKYLKAPEEVLLFIDRESQEKGQNHFITVLGKALEMVGLE